MPRFVIYATSGLLLIGALPLPYGYYTLLRLVVTIVFAWAAFVAYRRDHKSLVWALAFCALLYNPIIQVHLSKFVWVLINVISAIGLISVASFVEESANENSSKA